MYYAEFQSALDSQVLNIWPFRKTSLL